MSNYKAIQNTLIEQKVAALLKSLPLFCNDFYQVQKSKLAPKTHLNYALRMQAFLLFLQENVIPVADISLYTLDDLAQVTSEDAQDFANFMHEAAERTVDTYIETISTYYYFFMKNQYKLSDNSFFVYNPFRGIPRFKRAKQPSQSLDHSMQTKLCTTISSGEGLSVRQSKLRSTTWLRDFTICQLIIDTGISVSELVGIDIDDIDLKNSFIFITRNTGDEEKIYFSESTRQALQDYLAIRDDSFHPDEAQRALFLSSTRGKGMNKTEKDLGITATYDRLTPRSIQRIVKKYAIASDLPNAESITPQKLKSAFN